MNYDYIIIVSRYYLKIRNKCKNKNLKLIYDFKNLDFDLYR